MKIKRKPFKKENKRELPKSELEIENIVWGGKGIGRIKGKVFFVSKSVPEDRLVIKIVREKRDYGEGEIERIVFPSKNRVSPLCKDFGKCGGCQLQMMNYKAQAESKEIMAKEILRKWLNKAKFNQLVPMENPFEYRHSGDFHINWEGKVRIGFYEKESHKIVDFENCHLFSKNFNLKIKAIKNFLEKNELKSIHSFNLTCSEKEENFVASFFLKDNNFEEEKFRQIKKLARLDGILAVEKSGKAAFKDGECFLNYSLKKCGDLIKKDIKFKIDAGSFTQSNYEMNLKLVEEALRFCNLSTHQKVLELYSGVGNFTLPIALNCKEITAIEKSETAVEDSKFNATLNSIYNIRHIKGDVKEQIVKLVSSSALFDIIFLDPPRSGAYEIIESIVNFKPKRIIYVSCNLPTLERDLRKFEDFGYHPEEFSFFDLFPQTYGVETIVLLRAENEKN